MFIIIFWSFSFFRFSFVVDSCLTLNFLVGRVFVFSVNINLPRYYGVVSPCRGFRALILATSKRAKGNRPGPGSPPKPTKRPDHPNTVAHLSSFRLLGVLVLAILPVVLYVISPTRPLLSSSVIEEAAGGSDHTETADPQAPRVPKEPLHPVRQGLEETGEGIQRNHRVLDTYSGKLLPYTLVARQPHNKSSFT